MTKEQKAAVRCAHADLVGVVQAFQQGLSMNDLELQAIRDSIAELEYAFVGTIEPSRLGN